MKTPSFWYAKKQTLAARILAPAARLYALGGKLRRMLATPYHPKLPTICVGNIVAGGAGKTPVALTVASLLLQQGGKPVFVTRGYGGAEHGPLHVDPARHTARDVGDEALLLSRVAPVWVGRDRAAAIRAAEPHGTHIILDDGLQNPHIAPHITLLVIDGEAGLGNGLVIPAGPLREDLRAGLRRAKAVIITGKTDAHNLAAAAPCPVLRATWEAQPGPHFPQDAPFLAFAGIGRPAKFYDTCRAMGLHLVATRDFPDHHMFTANDLRELEQQAQSARARLLTTEKDWVRLPQDAQAKIIPLPATLHFDDMALLEKALRI